MLFSIESPDEDLDEEISEEAIKAAVNIVQVACQHLLQVKELLQNSYIH